MKLHTIYNIMIRYLVILIVFPFIYSCNSPAVAYVHSPNKEIAYANVANSKTKYTKHVRRQQKDICNRLKKIQKKLEKRKNKKKG